jgi:hypothetical protein
MTPSEEDERLARLNPWSLTAHQCMAMRLYCENGTMKKVETTAGVPVTTMKWHIKIAKKRMGYFGTDLRMYLTWDRWVRNL